MKRKVIFIHENEASFDQTKRDIYDIYSLEKEDLMPVHRTIATQFLRAIPKGSYTDIILSSPKRWRNMVRIVREIYDASVPIVILTEEREHETEEPNISFVSINGLKTKTA